MVIISNGFTHEITIGLPMVEHWSSAAAATLSLHGLSLRESWSCVLLLWGLAGGGSRVIAGVWASGHGGDPQMLR